MAIYATVRCNCYAEGRCSPPPYADDVFLDDFGYPGLGLPHTDKTKRHFKAFEAWLHDACNHPDMNYVERFLASGGGYYLFLDGLDSVGWKHFPTLHKKLPMPDRNFHKMSPDAAKKALEELKYFREHADFGPNAFLIDSENGEVIREYSWDGHGNLCTLVDDTRNSTKIGFNQRGLYVVQPRMVHNKSGTTRTRNRVVFQAKRFEQRFPESDSDPNSPMAGLRTGEDGPVEFINLTSGRTFLCNTPINSTRVFWPDGKVYFRYPRYLHIELRERDASYFDYIIEPLTAALEASVEIGNPVVWHEA